MTKGIGTPFYRVQRSLIRLAKGTSVATNVATGVGVAGAAATNNLPTIGWVLTQAVSQTLQGNMLFPGVAALFFAANFYGMYNLRGSFYYKISGDGDDGTAQIGFTPDEPHQGPRLH